MDAAPRAVDDAKSIFQFGDFTFDCRSRMLLRNGVEQHLSPKAQQLLHVLLLAWPSARSREDLYDVLWPSVFVCETNMAGIVSELRRALGDDARAAQYIRTVHGFGYAFCGDVASFTRDEKPASAALLCEGVRYPLFEGENYVGRAPDCRVMLASPTISRRHAVITVRGDTVWLADLDSKNGTYVDKRKIGSVQLTLKSRITFGAVAASLISGRSSSTQSLRLELSQASRKNAERMTTT